MSFTIIKVVSGKKAKNSIYTHQDAYFSIGYFEKNKSIKYRLINQKNGVFVFVIDGNAEIEKDELYSGDSAEITGTNNLKIKTNEESKFLVIEVPLK